MAARATRSKSRRPSPSRGAARGGWIVSLVGAAVLIAAGFASGLMIGVVAEEPELLLGHVSGRNESVPWVRDGEAEVAEEIPSEPVPQVAAAPPAAPAAAPKRAAAPAARPAPRPAAPDVAAAPPAAGAGSFAIQVGAFSSGATARKMASDLAAKGYAAYVRDPVAAADGRWRVRVGPLASREEADRLAKRLQSRDGLPTWVLSEEGS